MYPLQYKTGELVNTGDKIYWEDVNGLKCSGKLGLIKHKDENNLLTPLILQEKYPYNMDIDVEFTVHSSAVPPHTSSPIRVLLDIHQRIEVEWDKVHLERKETGKVFYLSGQEIKNGDWVVVEQDLPTLGRIELYEVDSEDDLFKNGNQKTLAFTHYVVFYPVDSPESMHIIRYNQRGLYVNGVISNMWEDIYFVRRDESPIKSWHSEPN